MENASLDYAPHNFFSDKQFHVFNIVLFEKRIQQITVLSFLNVSQ